MVKVLHGGRNDIAMLYVYCMHPVWQGATCEDALSTGVLGTQDAYECVVDGLQVCIWRMVSGMLGRSFEKDEIMRVKKKL